jgi:hypothetical protein
VDPFYNFVVALTRDFSWALSSAGPEYRWTDRERMLVFTDDRCVLNSTVLHEFLYWFRRVQRAFAAGLLSSADLYELWRQVLPFATDRRFSFLLRYWGGKERRESEDIEAIRLVVMDVIRFCIDNRKNEPLEYLEGRLDPDLVERLPKELAVDSIKRLVRNTPKGV